MKHDFQTTSFLKIRLLSCSKQSRSRYKGPPISAFFKGSVVVYFRNHEKRLNALFEPNEKKLSQKKNFRKQLLASSCISVRNSDGKTWLPLGALSLNFIVVTFVQVCCSVRIWSKRDKSNWHFTRRTTYTCVTGLYSGDSVLCQVRSEAEKLSGL